MDVYEFLKEQRALQNQRLNLVNPDGRTAFMKRAMSKENPGKGNGKGNNAPA